MTPVTWLVIASLILINALYVAAEFAAVSARRSRIAQLAAEGNKFAAALSPVIEDGRKLDRYVAACQIGITLSSLILGAYGQANLSVALGTVFVQWGTVGEAAAHSVSALVVLVGLTAMQVILGELVPKSLALQYPVQAALYTVIPMRWSLLLFTPLIAVLNGSGLAILRVLNAPAASHRHIHSPEEIELMLAESRDGGVLEPDEQRRLHQALRLGARHAHELMVPRRYVAGIELQTPVDEVLQKVANSPFTRLPVYDQTLDNVVGILHTKDLVNHYAQHGTIESLKELLRPVVAIPEVLTADRLLARIREERTHQAVVVDKHGGVSGLVTLEDVLAELLGDVADEFKAGEPQPERLPDGRVRLPGLLRLSEVSHWIGVEWQGDADTVGGYVTARLGHLPTGGERLVIDEVQVEVEAIADHAVRSLLVEPLAKASAVNRSGSHG